MIKKFKNKIFSNAELNFHEIIIDMPKYSFNLSQKIRVFGMSLFDPIN